MANTTPAKGKRTFTRMMSPKGKAAYAWVQKPDAKFNPEAPDYKITLLLPEAEAQAFEEQIHAAGKAAAEKDGIKLKKNYGVPIKRYEDDDNPKEEFKGVVRFSFKSKKKPLAVDALRNALPANVSPRSGDVVKVSFSVSAWATGLGSGISLYLNGVQLLEKNNTGGDGGSNDFGVEEGYVAPANTDEETEDGVATEEEEVL